MLINWQSPAGCLKTTKIKIFNQRRYKMYWLNNRFFNELSGLDLLLNDLDQTSTRWRNRKHNCSTGFPKVNVWKNNEAVVVTTELPGVGPSEIDLKAHPDRLIIKGERIGRTRSNGDGYQRSERSIGKFHREVNLPSRINPKSVTAEAKDGILRINLARAEEDKPKQISIKSA